MHRLQTAAAFTVKKSVPTYGVASESEKASYIKIDKPLVVYRFSGNVRNDAFNVTHMANFHAKNMISK